MDAKPKAEDQNNRGIPKVSFVQIMSTNKLGMEEAVEGLSTRFARANKHPTLLSLW